MTRFILGLFAAVFACLAVSVVPASAQFAYPFRPPQYGPYYQTQLSPWLNMLRGGDPAANYYLGVEPEAQRRQDRNATYGSLQNLSNQLPLPPGLTDRDIDLTTLTSTGHPTAFGYTGRYFVGNNNMPTRPTTNPFSQRPGMQGGGRGMGMPGMGMGGMGGSGGMWPNYRSPGMGGGMMR